MSFTHRIRNVEISADPADCDNIRFVMGHFGEDGPLLCAAFRAENPQGDCCIAVFTHDLAPRAEFCTPASLSTALPVFEAITRALTGEAERKGKAIRLVELFERTGAAYGKTLQKLAGL